MIDRAFSVIPSGFRDKVIFWEFTSRQEIEKSKGVILLWRYVSEVGRSGEKLIRRTYRKSLLKRKRVIYRDIRIKDHRCYNVEWGKW